MVLFFTARLPLGLPQDRLSLNLGLPRFTSAPYSKNRGNPNQPEPTGSKPREKDFHAIAPADLHTPEKTPTETTLTLWLTPPFRISDFGFLSDFGLRISDLAASLLSVADTVDTNCHRLSLQKPPRRQARWQFGQ